MDPQLEETKPPPVRVRRLGGLEGGDSEWQSGTSPLALFDLLVALLPQPVAPGGVFDTLCCRNERGQAVPKGQHELPENEEAGGPLAAATEEESGGVAHIVAEEAGFKPTVATTVAERLLKLEMELETLPGTAQARGDRAVATREAPDTAAVHVLAAGSGLQPALSARGQRLAEATAVLRAAAAAMTLPVSAMPGSPNGSSAASTVHAQSSDAAQRVAEFSAAALAAARARRMQARRHDGQPPGGVERPPVHQLLLTARLMDGDVGTCESPRSPAASECFSVVGQPDRIPDTPITPPASPLPHRSARDAALEASQRTADAVTAACDGAVRAGMLATQAHAAVATLTQALDLLRRQQELESRVEAVAAAEATAHAAVRGWERAAQELAAVRAFSENCDTPLSTYTAAIQRAAQAARHHAVTCLQDAHKEAEACLQAHRALADDWARLTPDLRRVRHPGAARSLAPVARGDARGLMDCVSAALDRGPHALGLMGATDRAAAALVGAVAELQGSVHAVLQTAGSPVMCRGGPHTI